VSRVPRAQRRAADRGLEPQLRVGRQEVRRERRPRAELDRVVAVIDWNRCERVRPHLDVRSADVAVEQTQGDVRVSGHGRTRGVHQSALVAQAEIGRLGERRDQEQRQTGPHRPSLEGTLPPVTRRRRLDPRRVGGHAQEREDADAPLVVAAVHLDLRHRACRRRRARLAGSPVEPRRRATPGTDGVDDRPARRRHGRRRVLHRHVRRVGRRRLRVREPRFERASGRRRTRRPRRVDRSGGRRGDARPPRAARVRSAGRQRRRRERDSGRRGGDRGLRRAGRAALGHRREDPSASASPARGRRCCPTRRPATRATRCGSIRPATPGSAAPSASPSTGRSRRAARPVGTARPRPNATPPTASTWSR
jgi:hypothetical protein